MNDIQNRRAFLRAAVSAGAAWAVVDFGQVEAALAWAAQQAALPSPALQRLSRRQADVLDAVTSRIIPAVDGRPGAREAGAVFFIDRALATFNRSQHALYAEGLADLDRRAGALTASSGFASLEPPQQDEILRAIEKSAFFEVVRFDTIVGTFALPTRGGNRDHAGWRMLGFEHQPRFQAPFGYYDAELRRSDR